MATLQKIRNRAGLLIAIIVGLALFAFVLGDMMRSGSSLTRESDLEIAQVAGKTLMYPDYMAKVEEIAEIQKQNSGKGALDESMMDMIREQTWDLLIRQLVMEDEYDEIGLTVCSDELYDMCAGRNIHPQVRQLFTDPNTGVFDTSSVIRFLKNMDQDKTGRQKAYWLFVEDALSRDRIQSKYNNLIKKGLYVTTEQAKNEAKEKNSKVNFKFIAQNYNLLSDSTIKITDADIRDYYEKNKYKFEQEASRDIEYLTFDVKPSQEDMKNATDEINKLFVEFEKSDNPKQFVALNTDGALDENFYTKGKLPPALDSTLFDAKEGTMYGPYIENDKYKIARLVEIKNIPDSVKASHILITVDQKTDSTRAKAIADSLKNLITKGANFADLAQKYSQDPGSGSKGGDLGWFKQGMMVKPFNDACFFGKKGDLTIVQSQFGVHLIKIVDKGKEQKNVMVAVLEKEIRPSDRTRDNIYLEASKFAGDNNTKEKFDKVVAEKGLNKKIASNLRENDKKIAGLENPRELVRWAYKSNKFDISPAFELGGSFVVAKLTEIREKGIATLEQKKEEIENMVRRDKKAEQLTKKIEDAQKSASSIEDLATKLGTNVGTAENISFSSFSIPGAGIEPVVIAVASSLQKDGKISKPLKGNNGIYVVLIDNVVQSNDADPAIEQKNIINTVQSQVDYKAYEAVKKLANLKDMRSRFF